MTKAKTIKLIKQFVADRLPQEEWYQKIAKDVKAIVFYGSRAKETNRPDSDVDILLILPLEAEKQHTTGEYVLQYEGQAMNIVIRSIERMRKIAEEGTDVFQAEIFRGSEIIWASDNETEDLIDKIPISQN